MPILFDDEEEAYLLRIEANPDGFVVNTDRRRTMPDYPMIHAANHKSLSSDKIGGFTSGAYIKICSPHRAKLEKFCEREFGRQVTVCATCLSC